MRKPQPDSAAPPVSALAALPLVLALVLALAVASVLVALPLVLELEYLDWSGSESRPLLCQGSPPPRR